MHPKICAESAALRGRKAEVTYPPCCLLLEEIVQYPVFRVEILLDVALADVVEEVEVEVLDAAAFQLFREDFAHLSHVFEVISWELVGQEIALAGYLLRARPTAASLVPLW